MRSIAKAFWMIGSCLLEVAGATVVLPAPFGGLLLVLAGAAITVRPKLYFEFFEVVGFGARLFGAAWLVAGLVMCAKHYL